MAFSPKSNKTKKNKKPNSKKKKIVGFPSDAAIIDFVTHSKSKVGKNNIARHFNIKGDGRIALKQTLARLRNQGKINHRRGKIANVPGLPKVCVLKVIGLDEDGEVKAVPAKWDEENHGQPPLIILNDTAVKGRRSNTRPVKAGDRVLARIGEINDETYAYQAKTIKRLASDSRSNDTLGVVIRAGKGLAVSPTNKKDRYDFKIAEGEEKALKIGDLISFESKQATRFGPRKATNIKKIGVFDDPTHTSLIALNEYQIPVDMPADVEAEAEVFEPFDVSRAPDHTDLRHIQLLTIDPPDARDHDDAVWATPDDDPENKGGFKVIVAIADVAYYVRPLSLLDKEAKTRGNSTYMPDRVVPMLPEKLSTDLCSLRPNVDRPALACFMTFDKSGRKIDHHFDRIIMRSAAKLSYQDAQDAIDGSPGKKAEPLLKSVLKPLWAAYGVVKKARNKRAPLNLDLPERKLIIGSDGLVEGVKTMDRFDAHKLIEEFMIQANVSAAETLEQHSMPLIYRVHDAPSQEKIIALAEFLKTLGLSAPKGQVMKPANFNSILAKAKGKDFEHVVNQVVLRSQSQAIYTTDNLGHFGLNLRRYAHFTSPIRRYADLTVHRGLIACLELGPDGLSQDEIKTLSATAEHISDTERRSMMAERDTKDRMIAKFLSSEVGKTFGGRIAGVAGAGLFVMLNDSGADGFVPISSLDGDYFVHVEEHHSLVGRKTGETFAMGDEVQVQLLEAAPVSGGLRLEMISQGRKGKPIGDRKRRGFKHHRRR